MHEQAHENDDPKQRLILLLRSDYTPPEKQALAQEAEDNAFSGLLANIRDVEEIDVRLASEENAELGRAVETLLAPAPVTTSFKDFIAGEVRRAHAWQSKVDDVVSPDRLGLLSGEGIFDPVQAKDTEAQTLRGYAFDIVSQYTTAPDTTERTDLPQLLLRPGVRPSDYAAAVDRFYDWATDYQQTYNEDPFENLEPGAYLDAAPKAAVMLMAESEELGWTGLVEHLRQLRRE